MKKLLEKSIKKTRFDKKRVFVRFDGNVSLDHKLDPIDDTRLQAVRETIDYLIKQQADIVLATHIGRPDKQSDHSCFSTKILSRWFTAHGYPIRHFSTIQDRNHTKQTIQILENLRFNPEEKQGDWTFAATLARLADCYINDAFGIVHRNDTSVTLLAQQFAPENRFIGIQMERELEYIFNFKAKIKRPFILIVGGAKIESKISAVLSMLTLPDNQRPDKVLLGGKLGSTVLNYHQKQLLQSSDLIAMLHEVCRKKNIELCLPRDHRTTAGTIVQEDQRVKEHNIGDIGPKTSALFSEIIKQAGSIVWSGPLGIIENKVCMQGTKTLLNAFMQTQVPILLGGGDTVTAVKKFIHKEHNWFISTGGSALLATLGCKNIQELPALAALLSERQ